MTEDNIADLEALLDEVLEGHSDEEIVNFMSITVSKCLKLLSVDELEFQDELYTMTMKKLKKDLH